MNGTALKTCLISMRLVFDAEAGKRSQRPGLAWIEAERRAMCDAVNARRALRGLVPVTMAAIAQVERMARGHTDYARKFPLYCAELALGLK